MFLAVFATACDPGYNEDMVIRNASSHTVTVIPGTRDCATGEPSYSVENKSYTLAPGEEVVIHNDGGLGSASFEEGVNYFKAFYGDSVKLGFGGFGEDGLLCEKTYYTWETDGISPYNFQSSNYTYEEKRNTGLVFHGLPYYGKLMFTITDEHYDAAMNDDETMRR